MKNIFIRLTAASILLFSTFAAVHADDEVAGSTSSVTAAAEQPNADIFMTLTRKAFQVSDLPTNTAVVTPQEFQVINAQNAGEAVSNQTSVQTLPIGTLGSALTANIRGGSSEQTLVMVDGRPYEGASLGPTDLSEIPTESIDHIEILRGGGSALYGPDAVGGVINIITKRAAGETHPSLDVGYEAGSFGREAYRLNAGARSGPLDYALFGDLQDESGFRDNSYSRTHNLGGNVGVAMGAAGKLLFDGSSYSARTGVPGQAYGPTDPFNLNGTTPLLMPNQFNNQDEKLASSPSALQITDTHALRASYILPLPMESMMNLKLFGMQRNVNYNDANDPNIFLQSSSFRQEQSRGGDLQFNLPLGFVAGGSFLHDHETNNDQLVQSNTFDAFVETWGTFLEDEIHLASLTLIPGVRYDHNSQAGDSTNPRLQGIEDVNDYLRLNASAAHSFRAPTIDDLFYVSPFFNGNPNLRPEKAWTFDVGYDVHNASNSFRTTYFYSNVTDLIQTVQINDFEFAPINVGRARRQGLEVELDDVFTSIFSNSLNYTYLNNRGVPDGFTDYVPLQYSPAHTVNDTFTIAFAPGWRADLTGRYLASRNSGNDNSGTEMGSQYLQDIRLAYHVWKAELYVGISDLFDKRYEDQPGYPLPGRTYFGGINLKLF